MKKRGFILLLAGLTAMLSACAEKQPTPVEAVILPVFAEKSAQAVATFPCVLADGLVVEELLGYDGPFWEDGSGAEVSGVAALMLHNTSTRMIEFGAVTVEQGGRILHFFIYDLPPGSRCLVAEWQQQPFSWEAARECGVGVLRWSHQELAREEADYLGTDGKLTVINRTARPLNIKVRYKRYDKEGDYFLGGMAFSAHFFATQPQQPKTLTPEYYHAGTARVVSVTIEE